MATFATGVGTGTFRFSAGDGMLPGFSRIGHYNLEHRPHSNEDVLDIGGLGSSQMKAAIIVLAANVATLENLLLQTGTLTTPSLSAVVRLLELGNKRSNFDNTHFFFDTLWVKSL